MKKIFLVLLVLVLVCFSFACTNSKDKGDKYEIKIINGLGGEVVVSKNEAYLSDIVNLTINLESGYELISLMINNQEQIQLVENNQYSLKVSDFIVKSVYEKVTIKSVFSVKNEIVKLANGKEIEIDGFEDDAWENVPKFYVNNIYEISITQGKLNEDFGWVKVIWDENGFYFYGRVYDDTVTAYDRLNIWFSEEYLSQGDVPYSKDPSDGNYAICVNPYGENLYYTSIDVANYWTVSTNVLDDGYSVEIFMPLLKFSNLETGMEIGLDISIDYYANWAESRKACLNWYGNGQYWSNVAALKKLTLRG